MSDRREELSASIAATLADYRPRVEEQYDRIFGPVSEGAAAIIREEPVAGSG
jgi:hypothetical protein